MDKEIQLFSRKRIDTFKYNQVLELSQKLKNKNIKVLLNREDIYTSALTLPLCSKDSLRELIDNEIRFYFKKSEILYDYTLLKKEKQKQRILLSCINTDKYEAMKKAFELCKSIEVAPIQLEIVNYLKSKKLAKDAILVVDMEGCLYFLAVNSYRFVLSYIGTKCNLEIIIKNINNIKEFYTNTLSKFYINLPKELFLINIKDELIPEELIKEFNCNSLNISKKEILYA